MHLWFNLILRYDVVTAEESVAYIFRLDVTSSVINSEYLASNKIHKNSQGEALSLI